MAILITHFPNWIEEGLFSKLGDWTPWADDEDVDVNALDIEYFGNRSGYKMASPLVDKMTTYPYDLILSDEQIERISKILRAKYNKDWTRLWDALQAEYNPIQNYDMVESGTSQGTETGTVTNEGTNSTSFTEEDTDSSTVTVDKDIQTSSTSTAKVKPLGGSTFVATREQDQSGQTLENSESNQTDTSTTTDITSSTTGSAENTETRDLAVGATHTLTRSGNIGVTTSQQMLESEYQLRTKHFFDMVFANVDDVLTIPYWR